MRFGAMPLAISASLIIGHGALADEGMIPLAESGDWIALAHHTSMLAPPDMCLAANIQQGVAFRSDVNGVQIRIINQSWSLPAGVQGSIMISVGTFKTTLEIDDNTSNWVNAEISDDITIPLFSQMDNNSRMFISVGKARPMEVSLSGSTKATNAFRTCAGIKSNAPSPGSNPFN